MSDGYVTYLLALTAFSAIAGWLFGVATIRSQGVDELVHTRRTLWRFFWACFMGAGAILWVLAALSMIGGGGGHPHPILIVAILGLIVGFGFVNFALFLMASHFALP